jgi:hypothetical protein
MPRKGDVQVVPSAKGWRVEVEGQSRAKGTHETQQAAWQHAKQIAQQNRSEALLHGRKARFASAIRTGKIRDEPKADGPSSAGGNAAYDAST